MYHASWPLGYDFGPAPPDGWKPPFRVVVSLTTTPGRLDNIGKTIASIASQSVRPDAIHLNVPRGAMARHPSMSYPDTLSSSRYSWIDEPLLCINRTLDYGPATKLLPTLEYETSPDTRIVVVDDDRDYNVGLIAGLAWWSHHFPGAVWGVSGVSMEFGLGLTRPYRIYATNWVRPGPTLVDVVWGAHGYIVRRGLVRHTEPIKRIPSACFKLDDEWLSASLTTLYHVPIARVGTRLHSERSYADREEIALSNNRTYQLRVDCFLAIDKQIGPWPVVGVRRQSGGLLVF